MNNFAKGICTIGKFNYRTIEIPKKNVYSAWLSVGNSFFLVGNDLRSAICEQKRKNDKGSK